jgi:uncharacterized membrane protein
METHYNRLAAQDTGRIAALSDGIFAFAMTVLVLEIHIPEKIDIHSEAELWAGLAALGPRIITWLLSLMTLGIFWVGQQTQINQLSRTDRNVSWLHFVFLAVITVLPFSTRLLAEFINFRTAFLIYWLNILLAGLALLANWICAERAGLVRSDAPTGVSKAIRRRIVVAQSLYAIGALLGFVSIPLGIGLIVLIQLNYAIAPRLPVLSKL